MAAYDLTVVNIDQEKFFGKFINPLTRKYDENWIILRKMENNYQKILFNQRSTRIMPSILSLVNIKDDNE
jgi:hypothetical protein